MRKLSQFEKMAVQTSKSIPLNIVVGLVLENAPNPEIVELSFQALQERHPLLSVQIEQQSNTFRFAPAKSLAFELDVISDFETDQWITLAEQELMRSINPAQGPLFFIHYLYKPDNESVLLCTFHHSIIDAAGIINLLDELLLTCASLEAEMGLPTEIAPRLSIPAAPEKHFPSKIKNGRLLFPLFMFFGRQIYGEMRYQWRMLRQQKHTVFAKSVNKVIPLEFSKEHTTRLSQFSRKHGVTLNSLLNAAMLFVLWKKFLGSVSMPLRAFSFADLRPYLDPPVSNKHTAPHTSMLRHTIYAEHDDNILDLAKRLNHQINQSFKRNEKFLFNFVSEKIMKVALLMSQIRMATSALSYSGKINLQEVYGTIKTKRLHGFISTPPFGPVLAAEAGILHGKLFVDFIYQDLDMDPEMAHSCVEEIRKTLISLL